MYNKNWNLDKLGFLCFLEKELALVEGWNCESWNVSWKQGPLVLIIAVAVEIWKYDIKKNKCFFANTDNLITC